MVINRVNDKHYRSLDSLVIGEYLRQRSWMQKQLLGTQWKQCKFLINYRTLVTTVQICWVIWVFSYSAKKLLNLRTILLIDNVHIQLFSHFLFEVLCKCSCTVCSWRKTILRLLFLLWIIDMISWTESFSEKCSHSTKFNCCSLRCFVWLCTNKMFDSLR